MDGSAGFDIAGTTELAQASIATAQAASQATQAAQATAAGSSSSGDGSAVIKKDLAKLIPF